MTHEDLMDAAGHAVASSDPAPDGTPPTVLTLHVAFDEAIPEKVRAYTKALLAQDVEAYLLSCANPIGAPGVSSAWGMGRANVVAVTAPEDVEDLPPEVVPVDAG